MDQRNDLSAKLNQTKKNIENASKSMYKQVCGGDSASIYVQTLIINDKQDPPPARKFIMDAITAYHNQINKFTDEFSNLINPNWIIKNLPPPWIKYLKTNGWIVRLLCMILNVSVVTSSKKIFPLPMVINSTIAKRWNNVVEEDVDMDTKEDYIHVTPKLKKAVDQYFTALRDKPLKEISTLPPIYYIIRRQDKQQLTLIVVVDENEEKKYSSYYSIGFGGLTNKNGDAPFYRKKGVIMSPDILTNISNPLIPYKLIDIGIFSPIHIERINEILKTQNSDVIVTLTTFESVRTPSVIIDGNSITDDNLLNCNEFMRGVFRESLKCSRRTYLGVERLDWCERKNKDIDLIQLFRSLLNKNPNEILDTLSPELDAEIKKISNATKFNKWNLQKQFSQKYNLNTDSIVPEQINSWYQTQGGCPCFGEVHMGAFGPWCDFNPFCKQCTDECQNLQHNKKYCYKWDENAETCDEKGYWDRVVNYDDETPEMLPY